MHFSKFAFASSPRTATSCSDKYIALRRCQKPVRLRNKSTVAVVNTVNVLAILQAVISGVVFYNGNGSLFFGLSVLLWLCFNVFPVGLCKLNSGYAHGLKAPGFSP
jgi:hypothetical protein